VLKPTAHNSIADRELAYRYVLSQDVDCVVPPRQKEEFLLALKAAERFRPLSPEEERDLLLRAPELQGRCRQCGFCLPCPEGLDVPFLLRLAGWFARFGQTREIARRTYQGDSVPLGLLAPAAEVQLANVANPRTAAQATPRVPVQADRCTRCGLCEERCPFQVPIMESLKQAHLTLASAGR
jgi:predicted aldo/keto reductase-like oxidoreductase